jgi:hypothetical protein
MRVTFYNYPPRVLPDFHAGNKGMRKLKTANLAIHTWGVASRIVVRARSMMRISSFVFGSAESANWRGIEIESTIESFVQVLD